MPQLAVVFHETSRASPIGDAVNDWKQELLALCATLPRCENAASTSVSGATIVRVSLIHLESLNRHHNSVGKFGFQPQDRWGFKVSPPVLPATPVFNQEDIPINSVEESILLTPLDSSNRRQQFEN